MIDFDTRKVLCFSEEKEPLQEYVDSEGLDMAVAIVSNEEELALQFSFDELSDLADNESVGLENPSTVEIWAQLEDNSLDYHEFPDIADLDDHVAPVKTKKTSAPKPKAEKPKKRASSYEGKTFQVGNEEPPKGRHTKIVKFVEEKGEATYEEICEFVGDCKGGPQQHVNWSAKKGFIQEAL